MLPPFGRILSAYQELNIKPEFVLYIFIGKDAKQEAFNQIKKGDLCSYLPYQEDICKYDWPINDHKVIIFDTGGMDALLIKKICYYLMKKFNPRVIFSCSETSPESICLNNTGIAI